MKPSTLLAHFATRIIQFRFTVILMTVGITAFLGSHIGDLRIDTDPELWAPQAHPYVRTTNVLEEVFGGRNVTVIGIVPKYGDIYQPEILAKIQRIQASVEKIPEAVRHNILSLAARKVKDIKGTAHGMEVRPLLETVPQTPKEIARLKAAVASLPIYINALVAPDGKAASVVADFRLNPDNPAYAGIYTALKPIVERERDETVDIYLGGLTISAAWFEFHMAKMPMLFGAALLIIMIIQYGAFRSFQGMLLPIVTALLSVVWGLGLMGLFGVHMDPMNTTTPILIMAVAAGHAIQILKRYYEEYQRLRISTLSAREASHQAIVETLARVGPVMITAGLIAIITFYSLAATGIVMVQHFGIFAGTAISATLVLETTFVPALRSVLPAPKYVEMNRERRPGLLDRALSWLSHRLARGGAPVILVMVSALLLVAIGGIAWLRVDNKMKDYHREGSEYRVHDAVLNRTFGGTNSVFFMVETAEPDGIKDSRVLQGMASLQAFLEQQPNVGKTLSLVDLVKRMNQAMHSDDPAYYSVPPTRDLTAQYLFLYSLSGDPQDFDSYVDNDYRRAAIWTFLKTDSSAYADTLAKRAQEVIASSFPPGVTVNIGGSLPQTMALNEVVTQDKIRNIVQMAVVVFVLSAIVFRSLIGGLFVAAPLVLVVLVNFGLLGWLNKPLDLVAAMTAAMAIGIGADFEIYLLFRLREELAKGVAFDDAMRTSMMTSGKATVFVAISVAAGYAVLQFSDFAFYTGLSTMVISTMVLSNVCALLFLRSLMVIFKPRFVFGPNRDALVRAQVTTP